MEVFQDRKEAKRTFLENIVKQISHCQEGQKIIGGANHRHFKVLERKSGRSKKFELRNEGFEKLLNTMGNLESHTHVHGSMCAQKGLEKTLSFHLGLIFSLSAQRKRS